MSDQPARSGVEQSRLAAAFFEPEGNPGAILRYPETLDLPTEIGDVRRAVEHPVQLRVILPKAGISGDISKAALGQRHNAHDRLVCGREHRPIVPASIGPTKDRRAGRGRPVRAARQQRPVPAPRNLAEAAARQPHNIRRPNMPQIRRRKDVDGEPVVVSDGKRAAVRRQRHPVRASPAWRLGFRHRPQRGVVKAEKPIECRHREPPRFVEAEAINRAGVAGVSGDFVPVVGGEHPDPIGTGKASNDIPPIGRPGEPIDDLRQAADPPDEPSRGGLEHIKAVGLLPGEPGPPARHDVSAIGRQGDGLKLALGPAADLRAQHPTGSPVGSIHSRNVLSSETVASICPAASVAAARIGSVCVPVFNRNTGCGLACCCAGAGAADSSPQPATMRICSPLVNARLSTEEIRLMTT